MKKICLILLLQTAALASFAQTESHKAPNSPFINPRADKLEVQGYTIILKPAPRNTYLYTIFQKGKLLHSLEKNPLTQDASGFASREEAFRVAAWALSEYQQRQVFPIRITPAEARTLQVTNQPKH